MKLVVETITGQKMSIPITGGDDINTIRSKITARLHHERKGGRSRSASQGGIDDYPDNRPPPSPVSARGKRYDSHYNRAKISVNKKKPPRLVVHRVPQSTTPKRFHTPQRKKKMTKRPARPASARAKPRQRQSSTPRTPGKQTKSRTPRRGSGVERSQSFTIGRSKEVGGRFITAIRVPRPDDMRAHASRVLATDRAPYVGDVSKLYTPRPTLEARHLREMGKEDFNTKFKRRTDPNLSLSGKRITILSATERENKRQGKVSKFVQEQQRSTARKTASRPWFELERPGLYDKHPNDDVPAFRTTFRTPRPSDLRIEAYQNAHDRGPYIGDIRMIPPGEISSRIQSARREAPNTGIARLDTTGGAAPSFKLHFHRPDTSRGIDGQKTELLSASDRRVITTARSQAEAEGGSGGYGKMWLTGLESSRSGATTARGRRSRKVSTAWDDPVVEDL